MGSLRGDHGEIVRLILWAVYLRTFYQSGILHWNSVDADSENVRCTEPTMWVDREVPHCETDLLLRSAMSTDSR
jgi:hypothetical protein